MNLERAGCLEEGERYWLACQVDGQGLPVFTEVTFIGYTACPAIVVVQDGGKGRFRCSRMDVYGAKSQTKSGCMPALTTRACISAAEGLD